MKRIIIVFLAGLFSAKADVQITKTAPQSVNPLNGMGEEALAQQMQIYNTRYMDDWRIINGITNRVTDRWIQFSGEVVEVHPGGIRVEGQFFCPTDSTGKQSYAGEFFVESFPYDVAPGDKIGGNQIFRALSAGVYKYNTVGGGTRALHKLFYGTPCLAPPKSAEQIEAERRLEARKKADGAAAALKQNQELADKGDAYGQLRMAERYRDGNGVETNRIKARMLFIQSADQGNEQAARELTALTNSVSSVKP